MKRVKFGDIVRDVKVQVDRSNNPYLHYVAGDHMDSMDLTIRRKGSFATDDVGPAFIRIFKPGQVLYGSRRTYLKKIAVADFEGICSNTTFVLETKDSNVFLQELLPFIMLSESFTKWSISHSKGSTNPYVLFSDLANYEFTLPSLSEQKVLADKLWAAYRVKESYKKLLSATDDMLKAKFQEMFGEEKGNHVKLRELIGTNFAGEWGNDDIDGNGTKVIKTNNFQNDGTINYDSLITRDIPIESIQKKKLQRGDILLERSGGTKDNPVGRVVYFDKEGEFVVNNFIQVLRSNQKVDPKYLFYNLFIYYHTHKIDIKRMGHQTSGIQNLKLQEFLDRIIPLPPLPLQQQFVEIATQAEATKESLRKSIENIDQVIKSLINQ